MKQNAVWYGTPCRTERHTNSYDVRTYEFVRTYARTKLQTSVYPSNKARTTAKLCQNAFRTIPVILFFDTPKKKLDIVFLAGNPPRPLPRRGFAETACKKREKTRKNGVNKNVEKRNKNAENNFTCRYRTGK